MTTEAPRVQGAMPALIVAILMAGVALRFVHLDADPDYYAWVGYVTDEGRWIAHAREMVLFGHLVNTDWLVHLLLAPLFQAASFVIFSLLGVSIWTSRLLTALSGSALLVLFWMALRRVVAPAAMLVALALLAFEVDLLMLGRVAVPEVPAMLLQLAVFLLVATGPPTTRRLLGAGLVLLAMMGTKATTVFLVPIFSVLVLLQPIREGARRRWSSLLLFWAASLVSGALLVGAVALAGRARPALAANVGILRGFLGLNAPYTVLAVPFESDFGPVYNMWALGLCLVAVAWLARRNLPVEPALWRVFVTACTWVALYSVLMVSLEYFPDRYRVHVLIPMAVVLATGITIVSQVPLEAIATTLRGRGPRAVAALEAPLPGPRARRDRVARPPRRALPAGARASPHRLPDRGRPRLARGPAQRPARPELLGGARRGSPLLVGDRAVDRRTPHRGPRGSGPRVATRAVGGAGAGRGALLRRPGGGPRGAFVPAPALHDEGDLGRPRRHAGPRPGPARRLARGGPVHRQPAALPFHARPHLARPDARAHRHGLPLRRSRGSAAEGVHPDRDLPPLRVTGVRGRALPDPRYREPPGVRQGVRAARRLRPSARHVAAISSRVITRVRTSAAT